MAAKTKSATWLPKKQKGAHEKSRFWVSEEQKNRWIVLLNSRMSLPNLREFTMEIQRHETSGPVQSSWRMSDGRVWTELAGRQPRGPDVFLGANTWHFCHWLIPFSLSEWWLHCGTLRPKQLIHASSTRCDRWRFQWKMHCVRLFFFQSRPMRGNLFLKPIVPAPQLSTSCVFLLAKPSVVSYFFFFDRTSITGLRTGFLVTYLSAESHLVRYVCASVVADRFRGIDGDH